MLLDWLYLGWEKVTRLIAAITNLYYPSGTVNDSIRDCKLLNPKAGQRQQFEQIEPNRCVDRDKASVLTGSWVVSLCYILSVQADSEGVSLMGPKESFVKSL